MPRTDEYAPANMTFKESEAWYAGRDRAIRLYARCAECGNGVEHWYHTTEGHVFTPYVMDGDGR